MNKRYKLVIFDLIDTLASGENILALTKVLEKEIGAKTIDFIIGDGKIDTEKSADDTIARVKTFSDISPKQEASIREWIEPGGLTLFLDSLEILKYLKAKSYLIGIISNSPPTKRDTLRDLQIDSYIDAALFSFECGYRKPDNEIFNLLLARLGVSPSEALMVGDSWKHDILGAQSAGIDALLFDKDNNIDFDPRVQSLLELKNTL